jgi:hypothetical protein
MSSSTEIVTTLANGLAVHLYELAATVEDGSEFHDAYMDAADALSDVVDLWQQEGL